ncbi:MAG: 23S rRNA (adenine(2503)-C(2))-methyltransferase RlmN [Fuerstiella sp.]
MSDNISIFDQAATELLRRRLRIDPQYVRVLRNRLLKKFEPDDPALSDFPGRDHVTCHSLDIFRRCDSEIDGATKLLLKTRTNMLIEAVVLRIATGRTTVCVSSQVGCAAACDFCATGRMGIARNLDASEILDQVLRVGQLLAREKRRLHNIVFMGMGEPFHNEENVSEALSILTSPAMFDRSPSSITVSTVGIPDGMLRCATKFPRVNLALSLHSVNPTVRQQLIPLTKVHPLDDLRRTLHEIQRQRPRQLMIEYLMLQARNDSAEDAADLIQWLQGLDVHVNLIPCNHVPEAPHLVGSSPETIAAFAALLKNSGLKTTVRYSLGSDIAAACGQLVRQENRLRATASR